MAISTVIPASNIASTITATAANTIYSSTQSYAPGVYTVTCASTVVAYVEFWNGSTRIVQGITVSGSIAINLSTAATSIKFWITSSSSIVISVLKTGEALSATSFSGTLDTITTSTTYTTTGNAYVVVVGAGGGGAWSQATTSAGGGGSGGVNAGYVQLTGSVVATVGLYGAGRTGSDGAGTAGGTTSFGSISATGGGGGGSYATNGGGGGLAGSPGGAAGGSGTQGNASAGAASTVSAYAFVNAGTTGGGSSGVSPYYGSGLTAAGGGSGIGTGGTGGASNTAGGNATGYGAGGGGGGMGSAVGGNGTGGVIYVFRF